MENGTFAAKVFAFVAGLSGLQAYAMIIIVLFACGLGLPIPEDITLFAAGFLAYKGKISLSGAFLVGLLGVLIGDSFMYWIGRIFGDKVVLWPLLGKIFTPGRLALAEKKVQNNARIICFTARFLPGLRAPIYLMSGALRVTFALFFLMDLAAALISVPVWIFLAYFLGDKIEYLIEMAGKAKSVIGIVFILLLIAYFSYRSWRRRNLKKPITLQTLLNED